MKKKILFVAADPPMPPTGGGLRTLHLLKALATTSICNLCILFKINTNQLTACLLDNCHEIRISTISFSTLRVSTWSKIITGLKYVLVPHLYPDEIIIKQADYFANNPFIGNNSVKKGFYNLQRRSLVHAATKKYRKGYPYPARSIERFNQFSEMKNDIYNKVKNTDLIWIDFSYLLIFFHGIKSSNKDLKIVCNAHNLEFKYLASLVELSKDELQKKWQLLQANIMRKVEMNGFAECDLVVVCSAIERDYLLELNSSLHIEVVPNGVDIDFFSSNNIPQSEPIILFTGNMNYVPNRDAVQYFVQSIFPKILKERPDSKFYIAGLNAGNVFSQYLKESNIVIVSSPDDMRDYYNKACVVAVPIRMGSGTRLKILEAAAMKKPIVSTPLGAEGLNFIDNEDLLIGNNDEHFSELVLKILNDHTEAERLARNAYIKLKRNYSWQRIEESVINIIRDLN